MGKDKKNKNTKSNNRKNKKEKMDDGNIQDERFQKAQTHPQFRKQTKRFNSSSDSNDTGGNLITGDKPGDGGDYETDDRFKAVLTDSRFSLGGDVGPLSSSNKKKGSGSGAVDKYGREQVKKKKGKKKKTENQDDESEEDTPISKKKAIKEIEPVEKPSADSDTDSSSSSSDSDSDESSSPSDQDAIQDDPQSRIAYLTALSRGEIDTSDSDESDDDDDDNEADTEQDSDSDSDDDDDDAENSIIGEAGILDPTYQKEEENNVEITFDKSPFLAVCNMDWAHVRAVDLLAIISSFSPPGSVKRINIYPSDFGIEQMKKDQTLGPMGIWASNETKSTNENDSDDSDDSDENDENDADEEEEEEKQSQMSDDSADDENDDANSKNDTHSNTDDIEYDSDIAEDLVNEHYEHFRQSNEPADSDFDTEKLRAYEASKLKYYFAVAEFNSCEAADKAYQELDGMEVGNSSAAMDLRSIPSDDVAGVVKDREVKDEATRMPSNYDPPDFVVAALQQTAVKCTWEEGDVERDRMLTRYGVGQESWNAMTQGDDLRAYLASDNSTDDESSQEGSDEDKRKKGANLRKMLGLGGDDDSQDDGTDEDDGKETDDTDDDSFFGGGSGGFGSFGDGDDDDGDQDNGDKGAKEITFIPGNGGLEEKIRSKLKEKEDGPKNELTPWEKYQLKRKEKRKERKRAAKEAVNERKKGEGRPYNDNNDEKKTKDSRAPSSKEELDLILAGDNDEEDAKDFNMRGLIRVDKNKEKKLRGSRKRKEADLAANVRGTDFKIDTEDSRFSALMDGSDERFGIDRTDPQYKETPAMREIMSEQTKRRKSNKRARTSHSRSVVADVSADAVADGKTQLKSSGALALSSLVKSLKTKVASKK